jgi:hypothetical protein
MSKSSFDKSLDNFFDSKTKLLNLEFKLKMLRLKKKYYLKGMLSSDIDKILKSK